MPKTKISEFSSTPANNTDIDSINIAEGCAPSGINDAIRELMSQLKDFQTGAVGDSFNGPIGSTTASTGAFTTLSASSTVSGTGFSTYLASPPAIGGTAAAAVSATTLSASSTLSVTGAGSIQGLTVGRGAGAVSTNTAVGASALSGGSQTGVQNTSVGYQTMLANTSGSYNSAFGHQAMTANTTGEQNAAFGREALLTNTTGNFNAASGMAALRVNTTGSNNTAFGFASLYQNTTASNNTALGWSAGYSNVTGTLNTFIGRAAGYSTTTSNNTVVGATAFTDNTTGANNVAVGTEALNKNTTASNNTAVGYQAGYSNTTGTGNTFLGFTAGYSTTGGYNTFIGNSPNYGAGYLVTTGTKNTIIGGYNGNQGGLDIRTASNYIVLSDGDGNPRQIQDGSGNIFWKGSGAGAQTLAGITGGTGDAKGIDNSDGARLLSSRGSTAAREHYVFYNPNGDVGSIDTSGTSTSYTTSSDYRLKNSISPMTGALAKVAQLKPVTYKWNVDGSDGQGFIAHELQEIVPECVLGEKDAVDENGNPKYQGIDTSFLVATLTAAIQELKVEFDAYKASHP